MTRRTSKTRNGYSIKVGDKIRFVGPIHQDDCVAYIASEMRDMVDDGKIYEVDGTHREESTLIIRAANWNWDVHLIEKVVSETNINITPIGAKPVMFDVSQLVT